jgi:hypothetical protein
MLEFHFVSICASCHGKVEKTPQLMSLSGMRECLVRCRTNPFALIMWANADNLARKGYKTDKKLDPVPPFKATAKLGGFLAKLRLIKVGPVLGGHHLERVRLIPVRTALINPDAFSNFLEARFWPTSGWPMILKLMAMRPFLDTYPIHAS